MSAVLPTDKSLTDEEQKLLADNYSYCQNVIKYFIKRTRLVPFRRDEFVSFCHIRLISSIKKYRKGNGSIRGFLFSIIKYASLTFSSDISRPKHSVMDTFTDADLHQDDVLHNEHRKACDVHKGNIDVLWRTIKDLSHREKRVVLDRVLRGKGGKGGFGGRALTDEELEFYGTNGKVSRQRVSQIYKKALTTLRDKLSDPESGFF